LWPPAKRINVRRWALWTNFWGKVEAEAVSTPADVRVETGDTLACSVTASSMEMSKQFSQEQLRDSVALRDWLLTEARTSQDPKLILTGLCERLNAAGIAVDRASVVIDTLHSEHAAIGQMWVKGEGFRAEAFPYRTDRGAADDIYQKSPFYHVHQTREMLSLWLPETPNERFGIVADLKQEGYVHYLCFPVFFANGDQNGITFATRRPQGFAAEGMAFIQFIMPAVAAVMEITSGYLRLDNLLRTYIGDEPHRLVLKGEVRRGNVSRIHSAIFFADMRNYTRLSSGLTSEKTVELLNAYFDCLVPAIEAEGGEVLKYMGDGLLAIFRDRGDDTAGAAQGALDAAQKAIACIKALNDENRLPAKVELGIALHHGEAAYGNVGSGARLDFTVVGRDVNLTSRLARLNKVLGEPLLMSQAFIEHLWADFQPLGAFVLDGIDGEVSVYRP
jgi:adenylate cyclase